MEQLKRTNRKREYSHYPASKRGEVALVWMTRLDLTHRKIDKSVLGLDPVYSRGYQSMGILHFQGLIDVHHGVLKGKGIIDVISEIEKLDDCATLVSDLYAFQNLVTLSEEVLEQQFQEQVTKSSQDNLEKRRQRIAEYNGVSEPVQAIAYRYRRNPDIVVEALLRAKGFCEDCHNQAPFLRRNNRSPYLEVHHIVALRDGGLDNLENVLALCPNCHRKRHYGSIDA